MIIGRDLIIDLEIDTKGSNTSITWDDNAMPWRNTDATTAYAYCDKRINKDLKIIKKILNDNYSKANIDKVIQKSVHLTDEEQTNLLKLMKRYEDIFNRNLGTGQVKLTIY